MSYDLTSLFELDDNGNVANMKQRGYTSRIMTPLDAAELTPEGTQFADQALAEIYIGHYITERPEDMYDVLLFGDEDGTEKDPLYPLMLSLLGIDSSLHRHQLLNMIGAHFRDDIERLIEEAREYHRQIAA